MSLCAQIGAKWIAVPVINKEFIDTLVCILRILSSLVSLRVTIMNKKSNFIVYDVDRLRYGHKP